MMRRWMLVLACAVLFAGCSGQRGGADGSAPALAEVSVDHKRAPRVAYEHAVDFEVPVGHTRQVYEAVQQSCAALPEQGCTLLEASIRAGTEPGATVRMRIVPEGVNRVLKSLDGRGKVVTQSSIGKDLAEPIQDAERKMGMLTAYRDQLQTLARQRALDPEALIKLHRELAEVQSEIDNAATAQAQLRRQVDTELLTVRMHEHARAGQAGKVSKALDDFGGDLLQGVAALITFVASTIPFVLAGTVLYLVWRRVRRGRRGAAADKR